MKFRLPPYIILLPVFFILHGLVENYVPSLVPTAIKLVLLYVIVAIFLVFLARVIPLDSEKAGLLVFTVLSINFFFGTAHDAFRENFGNTVFTRYSFLIPFFLLLVIVLIIYLRRTRRNFVQLARFLNILFFVLILIDIISLVPKLDRNKQAIRKQLAEPIPCNSCPLPDIYLIVMDEYAGHKALQELFSFDNTRFEDELRKREFYVVRTPVSNYNATVYSMASLLQMQYLDNLDSTIVNHPDMLRCRALIRNNTLVKFLKKQGYEFINHSYFDLDKKEKLVTNPFYPENAALFSAQTLVNRFRRNLGFHFASRQQLEDIVRHHQYNNHKTDSLTRAIATQQGRSPKFVYTHLEMPHHPYYFDSSGRERSYETLITEPNSNGIAYTGYLLYANKKILSLLDHILLNSKTPPIIALISDHGFRQSAAGADIKYQFMNFSAVYLPGKNYGGIYEGLSNVNLFRMILNNEFTQKLPLLKDSSSYFEEPLLSQ